jgi:hypothetical protein
VVVVLGKLFKIIVNYLAYLQQVRSTIDEEQGDEEEEEEKY